ncbi:MAG: FadR/GntR family transcriptional regulator [Paracoccaceae bacterium]
MKIDPNSTQDLSAQIATALRQAIIDGTLLVDARLPSESELATQFNVSRPTVREALKRLAAQSLIRTQRGATGGAFVNRLSYDDARGAQVTTSTLLLSMNDVSFDTALQARYALERACAPLAAQNRTADQLADLRAEIHRQSQPGLSDETFCDSDTAFHRTLVESAANPVLSWHLAGAIEAMQPLMNVITFTARSREVIVTHHTAIADALQSHDGAAVLTALDALEIYTADLGQKVFAARAGLAPDTRSNGK